MLSEIFDDYEFESIDAQQKKSRRRMESTDLDQEFVQADAAATKEEMKVDLERLVYSYIEKGDSETSATESDLEFKAFLTGYDPENMYLELAF